MSRDPLSKDREEKRKRRDDPMVFEGDFRMSHLWVVDVNAGLKGPRYDSTTNSSRRRACAVEVVSDPALTVRGEPSWSADSLRIVFSAAPTTMTRDDRTDVYIATHGKKTLDRITTNLGPDADPVWSPDGATIAYLSSPNAGAALGDGIPLQRVGNEHLMLYSVATGQTKDASRAELPLLALGELHWTPDSREIPFTAGAKTASDVFGYAPAAGTYGRYTEGKVARLGSVGKGGAALVVESSSEPGEVYFVRPTTVRLKPDTPDDFTVADFAGARRLTDTNPAARAFELGKTEVISWKSDGFTIEGVLLLPVNYQAGKRYPLLVVAHGGPTGAYTDGYRVSYGDGRPELGRRGMGRPLSESARQQQLRREVHAGELRRLGRRRLPRHHGRRRRRRREGVADPEKMAFTGWSYGGYMTCWVVSQTSRFKAAMMGAGITDVASMYSTTDIPNYLGTFFGGIPSKSTHRRATPSGRGSPTSTR